MKTCHSRKLSCARRCTFQGLLVTILPAAPTYGSSSSIANVSHAQVYSVEAAGNWGPVYFQGEYFWFNVDRRSFAQPGTTFTGPTLHFNGGYAEANWVVTGETRSYDPGAGCLQRHDSG